MALPEPADFENAEVFLRQAREAHESGDRGLFLAARHLIMVALGIVEGAPVVMHTKHLKADCHQR